MQIFSSVPEVLVNNTQTGVVASSSGLIQPLQDGLNHLLAYKMLGVIHQQVYQPGVDGTARIKTYRHPNCDYLTAIFYIDDVDNPETSSVTFTFGTGDSVEINPREVGCYCACFSCDSSDSGLLDLTYEINDCNVGSITIFNSPQSSQSSTDTIVDSFDSAYPLAGSSPGSYIIYSDANNGIVGLASRNKYCKENYKKQLISWCAPNDYVETTSDEYENPFDTSFRFKLTVPQWKESESVQLVNVYVYAYLSNSDEGDSFDVKVSSSVDSVALTSQTNTSATWLTFSDLEIDCTADDYVLIEALTNGAVKTPACRILNVSAYLK